MAPILAHSMPVILSPANVYSLKGGVVDVRTTSFSRYRGYSPTLRSVAASVFGAPRPSTRAAVHAEPTAAAPSISMTDLMRTTMPASTARSGGAVTMTIGGVRWSAGYFWGQLTLPYQSYVGETSGGNPPASNDGNDSTDSNEGKDSKDSDGGNNGSRSGLPPVDEPEAGDFGNTPIVTSNIPVTPPPTASVPEPGSLGLLSAGLLGLLALRRKQFGRKQFG